MNRQLEVTLGVEQGLGPPRRDFSCEAIVAIVHDPGVELERPEFLAFALESGNIFGVTATCVVAIAGPVGTVEVACRIGARAVTTDEAVAVAVSRTLGSNVSALVIAGLRIPPAAGALEHRGVIKGKVGFSDGGRRLAGQPSEPVTPDCSVVGSASSEGGKNDQVHVNSRCVLARAVEISMKL